MAGRGGAPSTPRPILCAQLSILEQVRQDVIRAMKAGDRDLASALRLLVSELQRDAKEGSGDELAVLRREHKRRLEAATQFQRANRPELAQQEQAEALMIARYLPPELTDAQLKELVYAAVSETGATGPSDLGPVMRLVMDRAGGLVDGKRASATVKAALAGTSG